MRRAYKFRAYPTRPQETRASRLLADHCDLYNAALEERREAWTMRQASITYSMQSAQLRAAHGSGNRKHIRRRLARQWRKVGNQRLDFHHKTARMLIDACDVIGLEKLNTAGMTRKPAPKPDPDQPGQFLPNQAGLNKSILDAGWAQFASILAGKAEEAARQVILVNPAYTSLDCHACGARCIRPRQDTVICPHCGPWDADVNAARNIASRAGLGSGQADAA